jgi:hypothetical protein
MQILAPCQGSKHQPHEPITFIQNPDQPWRCPLCDALDELDKLTQDFSTLNRDGYHAES